MSTLRNPVFSRRRSDAPEPDAPEPTEAADDATSPDEPTDTTPDATRDEGPVAVRSGDGAGGHDGSSVVTGILRAEATARVETDRRRRWVVSTAVLGLIVAATVVLFLTLTQNAANREATVAAELAAQRASFAGDVIDEAEALEAPARSIDRDALDLRVALEDHLVVNDRAENVVASVAEAAIARLREDADLLARLADPVTALAPEPGDEIDRANADALLDQLAQLRAEAAALAEEVDTAVDGAEAFLSAVRGVVDALAAHAAVVEDQEPTTDPDELMGLWISEREPLERLRTATEEAGEVPGLEAWSFAHAVYATRTLAWIDEAVALLETADITTYNDRFVELYDTDDPFGFAAEVSRATPPALGSPAIGALDTVRARAGLVMESVEVLELDVVARLGGGATTGSG